SMPSTSFASMCASDSDMGTIWRQHAPQPALQEMHSPRSFTPSTAVSMMASLMERQVGRSSDARIGPDGTVSRARMLAPATVNSTVAVTLRSPGDGISKAYLSGSLRGLITRLVISGTERLCLALTGSRDQFLAAKSHFLPVFMRGFWGYSI